MKKTTTETPETIRRLSQMLLYYNESQRKFGIRFQMDQSYLSTIINGHRKISGTVIKSMAKQNIDIKWLLTGEGEMFSFQERKMNYHLAEKEVSQEFSDLKDELIKSLKEQVKQLKRELGTANKKILAQSKSITSMRN